jgi:hypothetical protein
MGSVVTAALLAEVDEASGWWMVCLLLGVAGASGLSVRQPVQARLYGRQGWPEGGATEGHVILQTTSTRTRPTTST